MRKAMTKAHSDLAFSLRMQGGHSFERSLSHYHRAIGLKPTLAQACM